MSDPLKILVTGANGQLGSEIKAASEDYPFVFYFTDVGELDLTDVAAVQRYFEKTAINFCLNCAAYTNVDKAEEEPELAFRINVKAVENLARACDLHGVQLVHISTDFVFDGNTNQPYKETIEACPVSIYGKSKLNGEITALGNCERTMVIRTSWLYSSYGHNFVKTMIRLGKERNKINVVYDQIGTPTYAFDLAKVILDIIENHNLDAEYGDKMRGIYHYSNEGIASWYDFAYEIISGMGLKTKVFPIKSADYPTPAKRPHFSVMDKEKIRATFNLQIPHWRESIVLCLQKLK